MDCNKPDVETQEKMRELADRFADDLKNIRQTGMCVDPASVEFDEEKQTVSATVCVPRASHDINLEDIQDMPNLITGESRAITWDAAEIYEKHRSLARQQRIGDTGIGVTGIIDEAPYVHEVDSLPPSVAVDHEAIGLQDRTGLPFVSTVSTWKHPEKEIVHARPKANKARNKMQRQSRRKNRK